MHTFIDYVVGFLCSDMQRKIAIYLPTKSSNTFELLRNKQFDALATGFVIDFRFVLLPPNVWLAFSLCFFFAFLNIQLVSRSFTCVMLLCTANNLFCCCYY